MVKSAHGQLEDKSKGCFQPTFYRDVVAATTQSSKVPQNRVFDPSRDRINTEMPTSPKILSILFCSGQYESSQSQAKRDSAYLNRRAASTAATPLIKKGRMAVFSLIQDRS